MIKCDTVENYIYDAMEEWLEQYILQINSDQRPVAELIQQQCSGAEKKKTSLQIIPTTQHILDNYDILTILEKNQLWKLVLKKVTVYRSQDDELSIQLYPNLPK